MYTDQKKYNIRLQSVAIKQNQVVQKYRIMAQKIKLVTTEIV